MTGGAPTFVWGLKRSGIHLVVGWLYANLGGRVKGELVADGLHPQLCDGFADPHTGVANRPPVVLHPLEDLPPCLTCHGPDGFKARNQRHPAGSEDDDRCLECHAAGRGPAEREDAHPQVSP